tara:strand:- start:847 stop:1092 length:246 start_codon:yes stop_codon:yes gene_type:complete
MSDLILDKNLSLGAKILVKNIDVKDLLSVVNENIEHGIKDIKCLIIVLLCTKILNSTEMIQVCYDDISAVAKRLEVMVKHP